MANYGYIRDPNDDYPRPGDGPVGVPNMGGVQLKLPAQAKPAAAPAVRSGPPGPAPVPAPAPQTGDKGPDFGFNAGQNYFNTFNAADQARIQDTWGGANLMNEWFQNALKAGAVNANGTRPTAAPAPEPERRGGGQAPAAAPAAAAPVAAPAPAPAAPSAPLTAASLIPQRDSNPLEARISSYLENLLGGSDINAIKGQIFQASEGRRQAGAENLREDLASRGMFRSGERGRGMLELQNAADSDYTGGVTNALMAERAQKLPLIQALQSQLGASRQFDLGLGGLAAGERAREQSGGQFSQQLAQQGSQFDRELAQSGSQFDRQFGEQQAARAQAASAGAAAQERARQARMYVDPETGQEYELPEWMV